MTIRRKVISLQSVALAASTWNQFPALVTRSSDVLSAVDMDFSAVHVRARLRAQYINGFRHFVRRAEAMHRDFLLDDLVGARRQYRDVDLARRNGVDADDDASAIECHL